MLYNDLKKPSLYHLEQQWTLSRAHQPRIDYQNSTTEYYAKACSGRRKLGHQSIRPSQKFLQLQPQMKGTSEYSNQVVINLKMQFEVQVLRRGLGIIRQVYAEFMKSMKDSLGALRMQTQSVKEVAPIKFCGTRGFIDRRKAELGSRIQSVLAKAKVP
jgi:hypothetical protein